MCQMCRDFFILQSGPVMRDLCLFLTFQGRNEVCGIRDQKGGIWDHSPGIRDHKPCDRDQHFFKGSAIRLYHFFGISDQNLGWRFWNQGSEIWLQKWDQR